MSKFIKKAYIGAMTYEISTNEKIQAEKALVCFDRALKYLQTAKDYLNIIKTPFKDNQNQSPEEVMKARAALRKFRDKLIENFNQFKHTAFQCVNVMQIFNSDTQTIRIMKSFISSINDLEQSVNDLVELFNNLEAKDFGAEIVKQIEDVQIKCDDIEEIVEDRIKHHIITNILATTWVDSVGNELNKKIENKTPLLVELHRKQQEDLQGAINDKK